jgi:selenoprotein W-related protein
VAAELREAFPEIEVTLLPSSGGVFDVAVDGTLVFSKKQVRRHAEPGEIAEAARRRGLAG